MRQQLQGGLDAFGACAPVSLRPAEVAAQRGVHPLAKQPPSPACNPLAQRPSAPQKQPSTHLGLCKPVAKAARRQQLQLARGRGRQDLWLAIPVEVSLRRWWATAAQVGHGRRRRRRRQHTCQERSSSCCSGGCGGGWGRSTAAATQAAENKRRAARAAAAERQRRRTTSGGGTTGGCSSSSWMPGSWSEKRWYLHDLDTPDTLDELHCIVCIWSEAWQGRETTDGRQQAGRAGAARGTQRTRPCGTGTPPRAAATGTARRRTAAGCQSRACTWLRADAGTRGGRRSVARERRRRLAAGGRRQRQRRQAPQPGPARGCARNSLPSPAHFTAGRSRPDQPLGRRETSGAVQAGSGRLIAVQTARGCSEQHRRLLRGAPGHRSFCRAERGSLQRGAARCNNNQADH